jgi:hypothetical protein
VLIFGLVLFLGSVAAVMGLYAWAAWDYFDKPVSYRRPVKYVPPLFLLMGGIGAIVGLLLIVSSQSS